jgi:hypothetical protein
MRQAHQRPLEIRHVRREGLFQQHRPTADIAIDNFMPPHAAGAAAAP